MSYSKTSPPPNGLAPGETAVTLDDGSIIAVRCESGVEETSGRPVIIARARAIRADGSAISLPDGKPLTSIWTHASSHAEIEAVGGIAVLHKCCLMAVLGESTAPLWQDALHATALADASIRTTLAAFAHSGPVDAGALL